MELIRKQTYISERLTHFKEFVLTSNNLGFFDINKLAEGFISKILSLAVYGDTTSITVLDKIKVNFPAVDLLDIRTKSTIQVTAENNTSKLYETIEKFVELEEVKNKEFVVLKFFILNRVNYTGTQWTHIEQRFKENGLAFVKSESIIDVDTFIKNIRKVPETSIDLIIEEINNSLGIPYEMDMKDKFDRTTFEKFNGIINEETLENFIQTLHGGRPCLAPELCDEFIDPYIQQSRLHGGQFFNQDLQSQNLKVVKCLYKVRSFILTHYYAEGQGVDILLPPEYDNLANRLIAKDYLVSRLNELLENLRKEYHIFRGLIKDKFIL